MFYLLQVSLVGLSALLALLHHSQFYSEVLVMFSNFYAQPIIQPITWMQTVHQSPPSSNSSVSSVGKISMLLLLSWWRGDNYCQTGTIFFRRYKLIEAIGKISLNDRIAYQLLGLFTTSNNRIPFKYLVYQ